MENQNNSSAPNSDSTSILARLDAAEAEIKKLKETPVVNTAPAEHSDERLENLETKVFGRNFKFVPAAKPEENAQ